MQFTECLENEFAGKIALVLGGSSGIGLGAAELLARRGAKVIIIGHDDSVARATAQISSVVNCIEGFQGDASEEAFMRSTIAKVISEYGGIDILVNSAAIHPMGDVTETDVAMWDRTIAVNLRSMYLNCHLAIPSMVKRGGGVIINVVSPGSIITPMQEYFANLNRREGQTVEEVYKQFAKPVPLGRLGDVAETAELICFLASPRSGFCNGSEYVVDGGLIAGLRLY